MIVGTVKEVKNNEFRIGLTPSSVREYVHHGHQVLIESNAGLGAGFTDVEYQAAGAEIVNKAADVWKRSDMIVKVKEPLESEFGYLREGLLLYTYLHLAANEALTHTLIESKTQAVAYETIMLPDGSLPCLKPMSEVAGRLSVIEGAKHLEKPFGGSGVLVSGVPGVPGAKAAIIGAGVVGKNALKMLVGMGADVTVLDINLNKLTCLDDIYGNRIKTLFSSSDNIEKAVSEADIVIGAVLLPGAVPRTSTIALNNATLRYGLMIADLGLDIAMNRSEPLKLGVNIYQGNCTCEGVCEAFNFEYVHLG
jgi:alanine dehydrogenase